MSPSPDKSTAGRLHLSPSPAKHSENATRAAEDRKSQSPPKKFSSPSRTTNSPKKTASPTKGSKPFGQPIEIIKNKLYWIADEAPPQNIHNAFFFNIDNDLTYMPFNKDFGPLNLSMTHRFCRELQKLLKSDSFQGQTRIYHYTKSTDYVKFTNAVYLMCAFMVVILKMDA